MMKRILVYSLAFTFVLIVSCKNVEDGNKETWRGGVLEFDSGAEFGNKPVNVFYYVPEGDVATMPFQFIMHGAGRNAQEYLASWKTKADEYGLIIVAPEFTKEHFSTRQYNEGGFMTGEGVPAAAELTTFSLIDRIFGFTLEELDLEKDGYNIFGHSAGSQFVHRFLLFYNSPYVNKAVAANAGWYTYPDEAIEYPYGVKGLFSDNDSLRQRYHGFDLTILLGTADTIRDPDFRVTPEAENQGSTRLARGDDFFAFNESKAADASHSFSWQRIYVEGSGHEYLKMSPAAADVLYSGRKR